MRALAITPATLLLACSSVLTCASCGGGQGGAAPRPPAFAHSARAEPRLVGRFDLSDPARPRFAWSGSTIEAQFSGRAIAMRVRPARLAPHVVKVDGREVSIDEKATTYTVRLDDRPPFTVDVSDSVERYVLASGLDASPHTIAVTRDAEAFAGVHEFLGFEVDGGRLLAPRSRSRRIEIVGDSITCGYGVLGADARCPFTYATERASVAYGALAAQTLAADVTTVCWSGRGVVRNYDGDTTALAPELFEQAIPAIDGAPAVPFDFARAVEPDALVANLGTNDFLGGAGQPLDIAAFERAYVRFLRRVRAVYPRALLVVALSPMLGPDPTPSTASKPTRDVARASLERVVAMRCAEGDERISLLELEHQGERVGCDEHPNAEMHRVLARQLVSFLRGALRW